MRRAHIAERQLGSEVREFRSSRTNEFAGYIFGSLVILGGGALAAYLLIEMVRQRAQLPIIDFDSKELSWIIAPLLGFGGITACVIGLGVLDFSRQYSSHRLVVYLSSSGNSPVNSLANGQRIRVAAAGRAPEMAVIAAGVEATVTAQPTADGRNKRENRSPDDGRLPDDAIRA
jgi:hypothetical protein